MAEVLRQIGRGEIVWITSADGTERKATIAALSATSVDLVSNGVTDPVAFSTIARIEMLDPVVDGVQKGLMTGSAIGVSLVLLHVPACGLDGRGTDCMARRTFVTTGVGALAGGLIGWGLDRGNQKREAVYIRRSTVTVTPLFARRAAGFGAVIRW